MPAEMTVAVENHWGVSLEDPRSFDGAESGLGTCQSLGGTQCPAASKLVQLPL